MGDWRSGMPGGRWSSASFLGAYISAWTKPLKKETRGWRGFIRKQVFFFNHRERTYLFPHEVGVGECLEEEGWERCCPEGRGQQGRERALCLDDRPCQVPLQHPFRLRCAVCGVGFNVFLSFFFFFPFFWFLFQGVGFGVWGLGFGVWGLGFGVWGLRFGFCGLGFVVWGLGFGVRGLRFKFQGLGFGVWGLGCKVRGLGFGVWGLGFGVWGLGFGVYGLELG